MSREELMSEYYTDPELTEMLGLKPGTLASWRRKGEGPPYAKLGKLVRYDKRRVEGWIAENVTKSSPSSKSSPESS